MPENNTLQQLHIHIQGKDADYLTELLFAFDAESVTCKDTSETIVFDPDNDTAAQWQQVEVLALFQETVDITHIIKRLEVALERPLECSYETLAEQDWERSWMDNFKPIELSNNLWVCPSWHTVDNPNATIINLDPGLAFGTGTHETTHLCLEWLAQNPPQGLDVIDYGCGSGILAIAAAKLGAQQVWAVDNHPQAIEATQSNCKLNNLNDVIEIYLPEAFPQPKADLLIANILAAPLIELAPLFAKLVNSNGRLILSGILQDQIPTIEAAYNPSFTLKTTLTRHDWACLEFVCQS